MPFADVNGIRMHYERQGSGIPVLLVTGLAGTAAFWTRTAQLLGEGFDIIAVDNRGSGLTECEGEFTIQDMARDAVALLEHLQVGPAHVVGWSMGSHIALNLSAERPDLVRSLTLISSYLERTARAAYILEVIGRAYEKGEVREEVAGAMMNVLLRTEGYFESAERTGRPIRTAELGERSGMIRQMRAVSGYSIVDDARRLRVPVLSVHGLEDIMTPPRCGDELAAEIRGCEVLRIPGEGHIIRPETYVPAMLDFFKNH
ncbi:MAG: alpha/beta hydrolase [archaeon]|nr:alpha/beta hydrolase [archaeon]